MPSADDTTDIDVAARPTLSVTPFSIIARKKCRQRGGERGNRAKELQLWSIYLSANKRRDCGYAGQKLMSARASNMASRQARHVIDRARKPRACKQEICDQGSNGFCERAGREARANRQEYCMQAGKRTAVTLARKCKTVKQEPY